MAFATDPPYCVAYATDYKNTNDPSKMMPCEPLNHAYAMVTSNMVVRRLLSVANWEPVERKLTKGGRLLILRGMHFDSGLFPELVIPRYHAGPLVDSDMWQEVPFCTVGPFQAIDSIFLQPSRGSGIVHGRGSGQVERVGGFEPSQHTWVPAAFPTTCILQSG